MPLPNIPAAFRNYLKETW